MTAMMVEDRDVQFMLYEWLRAEELLQRGRFADHSRETFDGSIRTAQDLAEKYFDPLFKVMDDQEPEFDNGRVLMPDGVKEALKVFADAGFMAAYHDYEHGGMQLPMVVAQSCYMMFQGANMSLAAYPFLTVAASNMLQGYGDEDQIARYMPGLTDGRFFGTMCLSEPQAGSGLSDIRTKAAPADDGSYRISGNKMWISAGEHDLSDNIIHFVLARIEGAPAGVKGISLFIVPKYMVEDDGSLGARNDVALAGLNHKMGNRGTTNTLLNFGENGECVGYLLGTPHRGLAQMFQMMNEERLGVGMLSAVMGYAGYRFSLDYARNRPQGRHPDEGDPTTAPIPIIEHADVKRMLLAQKSYSEASIGLCLLCAKLIDDRNTLADEAACNDAHLLLEILTPIAKAWPSDYCLEANNMAIQILGGYGYTREFPVEQYYRDNRINPIHEGTNGIQGIDLLGRKISMNDGRALTLLLDRIEADISLAESRPELAEYASALSAAVAEIRAASAASMAAAGEGKIRLALANGTPFLHLVGHTVVAWIWLSYGLVADRNLPDASGTEADFYRGKLAACRYFFNWELPKTTHFAQLVRDLDTTCVDMEKDWF